MIWLWLPGVIWFVLVVAATLAYISEPRRQRPKPDYEKIARLERELGLIDPPEPPKPIPGSFAEYLADLRRHLGK